MYGLFLFLAAIALNSYFYRIAYFAVEKNIIIFPRPFLNLNSHKYQNREVSLKINLPYSFACFSRGGGILKAEAR